MSAAWLGDESEEEADQPFQVNEEFAARLEVFWTSLSQFQRIGVRKKLPEILAWLGQKKRGSHAEGGGGGAQRHAVITYVWPDAPHPKSKVVLSHDSKP